jgi:hypothetical protein
MLCAAFGRLKADLKKDAHDSALPKNSSTWQNNLPNGFSGQLDALYIRASLLETLPITFGRL